MSDFSEVTQLLAHWRLKSRSNCHPLFSFHLLPFAAGVAARGDFLALRGFTALSHGPGPGDAAWAPFCTLITTNQGQRTAATASSSYSSVTKCPQPRGVQWPGIRSRPVLGCLTPGAKSPSTCLGVGRDGGRQPAPWAKLGRGTAGHMRPAVSACRGYQVPIPGKSE